MSSAHPASAGAVSNAINLVPSCCRCHFSLPSVEAEDDTRGKMPPIKVKFEIPYFTVSGIQVRGGFQLCFDLWIIGMIHACIHKGFRVGC